MPHTQTGGGSYIAGDASADRDLVGRDQAGRDIVGRDAVGGNNVHIAMERMAEVSERETDQIRRLTEQINRLSDDVTALTRALIGDPRFGATGLVQQVKEMSDTGRQHERWRQVTVWVLALIAFSQLAQWYLLWRVWELYWAIYATVS